MFRRSGGELLFCSRPKKKPKNAAQKPMVFENFLCPFSRSLFLDAVPAKGMIPRSGAGDFVARQSHQNWFRNLRFLKTSLSTDRWCGNRTRRVDNGSTVLFSSGVTPYIVVVDSACRSSTAPTRIYHDDAEGDTVYASAIGTQTK